MNLYFSWLLHAHHSPTCGRVPAYVSDTCMKFLEINTCKSYMLITWRKCFRINNVSAKFRAWSVSPQRLVCLPTKDTRCTEWQGNRGFGMLARNLPGICSEFAWNLLGTRSSLGVCSEFAWKKARTNHARNSPNVSFSSTMVEAGMKFSCEKPEREHFLSRFAPLGGVPHPDLPFPVFLYKFLGFFCCKGFSCFFECFPFARLLVIRLGRNQQCAN